MLFTPIRVELLAGMPVDFDIEKRCVPSGAERTCIRTGGAL